MNARMTLATLVMVTLGLPAIGAAQKPTFDCAKAQGEVEQLICSDAGLAAADRKLDEVYKAAVAKAKGTLLNQLRTEQRGWVKGRNDCWKTSANAPAFLTASWQVSTVRDCVDGQYRLRTSELQALWRLLPPKTVTFACEDNPANAIVADFFDSDPPSARLERGDTTVTVWLVPAASGAKYEGQNVTFWTKGTEATASWLRVHTGETEQLKCRVH
ncbi:MAG: MliC family protein [Vicinamibacterales bacterium]|nr:MliC family protein [Vicinamibacterales bacterium]